MKNFTHCNKGAFCSHELGEKVKEQKRLNSLFLRSSFFKGLFIAFLFSCFYLPASAGVETIPKGSRIINMGVTPQTVANGLKPYGLVYALLKANIPVKWVISQTKVKDGVDFSHNGVDYKGSAFIISSEYITLSIDSMINAWKAKGVVVNTTVSDFSVDVTYTIKAAPFWVMDAQNGRIAIQFLNAAEIPSTSYIFKDPSQLTGCDDIYVMPHADPTWETHKNLYYWNLTYKGAFWGGCHAVSVLENTYGKDIYDTTITRRLNFLMSDGTAGPDKNAVNFRDHSNGSVPYINNLPSHPVMQFIGSTDAATQGGSEQIFMPYKPGGSWRPQTNIGVYDPSQVDVPTKSDGPAATVVFGHAYGDQNRGQVVYEGGHDISGSAPANVAAQRVFFNSAFLFVLDKQLTTSVSNIPTRMNGNTTYSNFTISATSPIPNNTLTYQWTSSVGGTFSNPNGITTNYTPPAVLSMTTAVISCVVTDACGRVSAETQGVIILPGPMAPIALPDSAAVPRCANNITTFNVLANDYDPNGDPMTVTLLGQGQYGTFKNNGNGVITYTPVSYAGSYDDVQYKVCDPGGLCTTSTITAIINVKDGNGCNPDQYYGIAQTISAAISTNVVGAPGNPANALDVGDGVPGDATSYSTYSVNGTTVIYSLSSAIPSAGTLRIYLDASTDGKTITVEQSSDSTNWTNSTNFTVNSYEDFLEAYAKKYTVNAGTKWIRFKNNGSTIYLDAMEYDQYSCVSAAPSLAKDLATTLEDVPVTVEVLGNDSDPLGKNMVVSGIAVWPTHGSVSINPDNTITYLNNKDQNAADSFTYRVVNAAGLVSTAKVFIKILPDACTPNKYQAFSGTSYTATLNPADDNYLRYSAPTINYGSVNDLRLKGKLGDLKRPVFKFNIASLSIPSNAIIDTAIFSAYLTSGPANEIVNLHRVTEGFTEVGSTWNYANGGTLWTTPGGTYDSTVWASRSTSNVGATYLSWNVKSLVQSWVQGTYANNGFIMKRYPEASVGTFKDNSFAAKEKGTTTIPKLFIKYFVPAACANIPLRAAMAMPDTASTNSITPVTINVVSNDYDYSGKGLTISRISLTSAKGGTITQSGNNLVYTPPATSPRYNGVDTFMYRVTTNSLDDSALVFVDVTNAPPAANVDFYTLQSNTSTTPSSITCDVRSNDTDPEGSSLTTPVITIKPKKGTATIDASGNIIYTPTAGYYGKDSLVYEVGEAITGCNPFTDTAKVVFTITNRPPVGVNDNVYTNACEVKQFKILANDSDPEGGNMKITITQAPGIGTATLKNNGTVLEYTPPVGVANVTTTLQYQACDDANPSACSNTTTVTININPVPPTNNPPIAVNDTFYTPLNETYFADVLTNDSEPDGQLFATPVTIVTNPTKGTVTTLPNGLVQYTPNSNFYGVDSFLYRVYDSIPMVKGGTCTVIPNASATAWAYIIVQNSPIARPDYIFFHKNTAGTINVLANDIFGADGPANGTISIVTMPKGGMASVNAGALADQSDDKITYVPSTGFAANDTLIYRICDTNGDCDTALVVIQFYPDTDGDGTDDQMDIDDDNDGIPDYSEVCGASTANYSCVASGTDPALDDDLDGIVNYKDADYGALNSKGCVAALDSDGDGIPDFLDLDSDNDGIPDVVEAGGADSNGDGMIDNFTDTDGDGLSQNVDANNTGVAGSGAGLGINDLDGDGVPNRLDLDSDDDGIPDIVEALGTDANNDGRVDGTFNDLNKNGWLDAYEAGGALIITGADNNNDGRADSYPNKNADMQGGPNPYDLDSDGDGITDAIEAGFAGSVTVSNGVVLSAKTNGWANSVKALGGSALTLSNTDGRGPANYLDIDSDDDGISDNIEAQSTSAYKTPTITDADNDGINDVYETMVGTYGGEGITLNDEDGDGTPDYKDSDSDNDGLLDINEASKINTLTQANINVTDTDGDGLVDQFDILNVKSATGASVPLNVANSNMGDNGSFTGSAPSGSNVLLVQSLPSYSNRDWRTLNNLTLGNSIWYDFNANGIKDAGETGISGVTVNLYVDANGDNVADGGAIISTVTDASGTYQFTGLSKTKYIVGVVVPAGYTVGTTISSSSDPNNGTDNDNNGINVVGTEVRSNYINLLANNNTLDIGLKGTSSIGDFVWFDVDANGIQNVGENGLANATVTLTNAGGVSISTTSDATGLYTFNNIGPGTYTIVFTTPAGYVASPAGQGGDITKDSDPVSGSSSITITAGQLRTNVDAGFYQLMNLGSNVWFDVNGNGIKDAGEVVVSGATVKLYADANNDDVADGASIATVTTNASGVYSFTGLTPGNYIVGVTLPAGYALVAANGGDPDNDIDNDNNGVNLVSGEVRSKAITLSSGGEPTTDGDGANGNLTVDFALKGTGSIGNFVWNDLNGNGIQDAGEAGMEGISVSLTSALTGTITTTTDGLGNYTFPNLPAGIYTITFTTPSGYFASPANQGSDATKNSDPVSGSVSVTLTSGQNNNDVDAGFYLPFTLGNFIWYDFNKNGTYDAGESPLIGATVHLYLDANGDNNADGGTVIATATTDVNGYYQFTNLSSGKYIIGVGIPTGYALGVSAATSSNPDNDFDNDNNGVKTASGEARTNYISLNENNNTLDIGLVGNASIGDFVWMDTNGNGIQENGEAGMAGVAVTITNGSGASVTANTDGTGKYSFSNLVPGTYTVSFATPSGYYTSPPSQGTNNTKDSDPVNGSITVTVTSGQTRTDIDAGFFLGYTIGNKVWFDINKNGTADAREGGFAGLTVHLYTDTLVGNVPDGAAYATTTTDASGFYQFTKVPPGKYVVGVVLPAGYGSTITTASSSNPDNLVDNDNNGINVISGELLTNNITANVINNTVDIGIKGDGSIGDLVFNDLDNDGIQDVGEPGMAGVTVDLTIGTTSATVTTDANGNYSFANLVPGNYTIAFTTPSGYIASPAKQGSDDTKDSDPVAGSVIVAVSNTVPLTTVDAGFFVPSSLGNTVWYDFNKNGVKDAGEVGISGATVSLYKDDDGNNVADGAAVATTTTNASGVYQFSGLAKGKYIVGVSAAGYAVGKSITGSDSPDNNVDDDNNGINTVGSEVRTNFFTLTGTNNTLDIGLYGTSSIGDWVWNDLNGNGIQDAGETGLQGATVSISNGSITLTTTSDANGLYNFSNLAAGTYTLTFTTPAGYLVSASGQGSDITKNSDPTSGTVAVTVAAAQVRTDIDAGFYLPFTLGNLVWYDHNKDGLKDASEPGISGATVRLYLDANADNNADGGTVIASTTTDANGNYQFTNLASGKYIVGVVIPSGYAIGTTFSTTPDNGIDNDNNGVKTAGSEVRTNYISISGINNTLDIALIGTASIGNFVWNDVNGNGIQDGGAETGIQGATVTLLNSLGQTLTTTTNSSGAYSFNNLAAGNYTVTFTTPSGYLVSPANAGNDDGKDSDPVNGSVAVTLTAGQSDNTIDAGFYQPYTIGNQVFYDFNNNGVLNSGETGVENVTVNLYQDNNSDGNPDGPAIQTTTTDANGIYQFTLLPAGNYLVGVEVPYGYLQGANSTNSANPNASTDNDNNGIKTVGGVIYTNTIIVNGSRINIDFGLTGTAYIGNYTWTDANGNGVQDDGEQALSGVQVTLETVNGLTMSTTTDIAGFYNFANLGGGTYKITFKTPNGYMLTGEKQGSDGAKDSDPVELGSNGVVNVTIADGEAADYIDAGYFVPFPLGNLVFYDLNNNGVKDANEKGISGLTVNLYDDKNYDGVPDGNVRKSTTTDAAGAYMFTDLRANGYIVGVVLPTGYAPGGTTATSADPNNQVNDDNNGVVLAGSLLRTNNIDVSSPRYDVDFGLRGTGSIGDFTWFDANNNGLQDAGESGLAGVVVTLTHSSGASVTDTSRANGAYSFTGLIQGNYTLTYATPTDYSATLANVGSDDNIDSDPVSGSVSVSLTAGQAITNVDAGYNQTLTLGNKVFYDFNNNGLLDANETGISGATVKLYADANADNLPDGAAIASTTTTAAGIYEFSNLGAGKYIVGVTLPSGYVAGPTTATSSNPNNYIDNDNNGVTTVSGEVRTNYINLATSSYTLDIGLIGTASIGDWVWTDADADGQQDAAETTGIAGVTVTLSYTGGPTLTTTTNSSGNYSFTNLAPGTYTVAFTTPFGYLPSPALKGSNRAKDSDPSGGVTSVTLTAGLIKTDVDAGFTPSRSIGNNVWYDINNNGVRDAGEPGIAGVTVKRYADNNMDNVPDGGALAVTTTNSNGDYVFSNVSANEYIFSVLLPTGYVAGATTSTSADPNNGVDGDNNGVNTVSGEVRTNYYVLSATTSTIDFGLAGTGSIGNLVFADANANGIQDAGETGIAGAAVSLTETASGSSVSTTTDVNGNYSFNNLAPKTYNINFTTPAGYTPSPAQQGSDATLDSDPVSGSVSVTLTAGQVRNDIDAGFYQGFSLGNRVWYDFNNNGLKDAAETGIANATVHLYADSDGNNVADGAAVATTATDGSGYYQFSNLTSGKYIVGVVVPTGYSQGVTTDSSANPNNHFDNDNNGVQLVSGEVRTNFITVGPSTTTVDIGLKGIGTIGNLVWNDANGNGIRDAGEAGLPGAVVTLTNSNGSTLSAITTSGGFYSFSTLAPGTYTIVFTTPAGHIASPSLRGNDRTVDSDPVTGSVSVTLAAGEANNNIDAGFYLPYKIGNTVWFDFNNNGTKDAAETGISGATVYLYQDANGDNVADGAAIATTTTNATGVYQFSDIAPGNYVVGVQVPTGYTNGTTTATSSDATSLIDNDNNGINVVGSEVRSNTIALTATNNTVDFGFKGTASIGNLVFNDVNGNGIQDNGEAGLAGATVTISNADGLTVTTTSDVNGNYLFSNLAAGTYDVSFTTPANYIASRALQGSDRTKDSDPTAGAVSVTLTAGQVNNDVDAGFYIPFTVGNFVWYDFNNNGIADAGESGMTGATVYLYEDNNKDDVPDGTPVATTTTDTNGLYQFTNVAGGNYIVSVVAPSGYGEGATIATSSTPGNNVDNDNNGVNTNGSEVYTNSVLISTNNQTIDIGLKAGGSVSSWVWLDANGNNIQDAGEQGIPGVTVTLTTSGGGTLTTTTDANGRYSFPSLTAGNYIIHFDTPKVVGAPVSIPLIPRKADIGGDDTKDSDPNPATGSVSIVLTEGQQLENVDAGFALDQDDDNDGISNSDENGGYDPFADSDGDGIPNYKDPTQINGIPGKPLVWKDVNGDGINDFFDFDLDGIINELDLDSDNDGILDINEARDARMVDANHDGMADGIDNDGDGIAASADIDDNTYGTTGLVAQDLDKDGLANFIDLDSDADGIPDLTEATGLLTGKGMVTGTDTDGDGILAELFGSNAATVADNINGLGGKGVSVRDTDGDGIADPYDVDSDNDGILDQIESLPVIVTGASLTTDTDGDGIADAFDNYNGVGTNVTAPYDYDGDSIADHLDLDSDNDGIADNVEWQRASAYIAPTATDVDGDGLLDVYDLDTNTLGGGSQPIDSDGDGLVDNRDRDSDNDGIADVVEAYGADANGDGIIDNFSDADGDGLSQNVDANTAGFTASGTGLGLVDLDGDGVANNVDLDSDNDGIPDVIEAGGADSNNDGLADNFTDSNANGWKDSYENAGSILKTGTDGNGDGRPDSYPNKNADGTGLPNPYDLDSDGDGLADNIEAGFSGTGGIVDGARGADGWSVSIKSLAALNLTNTDGTGPADYLDLDSDDDGIGDNYEWQQGVYVAPTATDTDNDGIADVYDDLVNAYGGARTPVDTDGDGKVDYKDLDSDNDGISDLAEWQLSTAFVAPAAGDADNDGLLDVFDASTNSFGGVKAPLDSDGDNVFNFRDKDSDNDGIPDVVEAWGADPNGDGTVENFTDADGDGFSDNLDANDSGYSNSGTGLGYPDLDGDGVPNYVDLDSDNDGIPDVIEVLGNDNNNDGMLDDFVDANQDGRVDAFEGPNSLLITSADANGDGKADGYPQKNLDEVGKPNPYDLDADGDGIADAVEAGFGGSVTIVNGMVTGARTNGWANSVKALTNAALSLRNTDGRGLPDFLDIDSDDDGIQDNVEGQPTTSFIISSDVDTDGDGIADVYDLTPNTYGAAGITPFDFDSDGIPDYRDSDTDNDGALDINEASKYNTLNQSNINIGDADGDGLVDEFDGVDVKAFPAGSKYINVSNSNMGTNGNFDGPVPSGAVVKLIRSALSGDRDWRNLAVLPIRIVRFTGSLSNQSAMLNWVAENEQEVDHYQVQRSTDGRNFENIGSVTPKNAAVSSYDFTDDLQLYISPVVYYRIRQVNKAGNDYYTNVINFKLEQKNNIVKVYPIPFANELHVNIRSFVKDTGELQLVDMQGNTILKKTLKTDIGINDITIPEVGRLAHGSYILIIKTTMNTWNQLVIKQ